MNISKFTINDIINENIVKFNYDFEQKDKVVFFDFLGRGRGVLHINYNKNHFFLMIKF